MEKLITLPYSHFLKLLHTAEQHMLLCEKVDTEISDVIKFWSDFDLTEFNNELKSNGLTLPINEEIFRYNKLGDKK